MKIYKYASMDKAIKILEDGRLLLNNPMSFNDPFDNNIKRDKRDVAKVRKIVRSFTMTTMVVKASMDKDIAAALRKNVAFSTVKAEHQLMVKNLRAYPRFYGDITMETLYKMLGVKNNIFTKKTEEDLDRFEKIVSDAIEETKKDTSQGLEEKINNLQQLIEKQKKNE